MALRGGNVSHCVIDLAEEEFEVDQIKPSGGVIATIIGWQRNSEVTLGPYSIWVRYGSRIGKGNRTRPLDYI